jgi:hypothetical protein
MKEFKDDWVRKKCVVWRRGGKDAGVCTLHKPDIFTEEGVRRKIRTFGSDGCERWRAGRGSVYRRVRAEVKRWGGGGLVSGDLVRGRWQERHA